MKKLLAMALALIMVLSLVPSSFAEGQTTIKWWVFPTFGQPDGAAAGTYEKTLVEAFEAKNPNIKVEIETIDFTNGPDKLVSAIEGNTAPDVLFDAPGRIIEYGKNGKLVKLNDLFTDEFKKDVNNEGLLSACSDGTDYYMYPISASPFYMAINKDIFEKTGALEFVNLEGDRTWTTENFLKALDKLHEAGQDGGSIYCGGQGGDQGTRAFLANLYGARIANDAKNEYTFASEEGIKALNLMKELADAGKVEKGTDIAAGEEIKLFVQGVLPYSICWGTSAAKNNPAPFEIVSLPFPSNDGVPELEYLVNGFGIFDNKDEARANAAKEFVKFLCDDAEYGVKNVIATGAFPVRTSFGNLYEGNAEYELLSAFTKYYGAYYNTMDGFAAMRTEWWNMLQAILVGTKDVATAAADYTTNSNAVFKK